MRDPDCTVVIATFNRRECLAKTLSQLSALPERPPIIVVDNGSVDGSAAAVTADFPDVRVVRLARNIGAAARNFGVAVTQTPYVAFCDDDCRWAPGALAHACALLDAHPGVGVLNARVVINGSRTDTACARMAHSPLPKRSACPGTAIALFMAGAAVMRRIAFLDAGRYHRRYHLGAEESLLAIDLLDRGWELVYVPDIVVHHAPYAPGRTPSSRRVTTMRNRLWTAWLRYSVRRAFRATVAVARAARTDVEARAALRAALSGIPWILCERKRALRRTEQLLDALCEPPD